MALPRIIQGGMGAAISDWTLAKAVSIRGQLGVVSATGISTIMIRRLQDGDPNGDVRRALEHFHDDVLVKNVLNRYFNPEGRKRGEPYKNHPMPLLEGGDMFQRLTTLASFVEVFLAKEGHNGMVGINLLEKIQVATLASLYGAMLANVDYVLMGAGIPREIPGILDQLAVHEVATQNINVIGATASDKFHQSYDPRHLFPRYPHFESQLTRPMFLAIVSSTSLAQYLFKKANGRIDGFVVEHHTAGGHNAPPRNSKDTDVRGEVHYSEKDEVNYEDFRKMGLPFWLAGSMGSPHGLQNALAMGASGIQIGTAFAFCNESGMSRQIKEKILKDLAHNPTVASTGSKHIYTDRYASPTGFPFKVLALENSLSEEPVYKERERICDLGYLRQIAIHNEKIVYRCPAEPVAAFISKGGDEKETHGRKCLCNGLMANVDLGQMRDHDYQERPLLTAGEDIVHLKQFFTRGETSYSAQDVLDFILESQIPLQAKVWSQSAQL